MNYMFLASFCLYLQVLLVSASVGASYDRRDEASLLSRNPRHAVQQYKHVPRAANTWSRNAIDEVTHQRRHPTPHIPYGFPAQPRHETYRRNNPKKALLGSKKLASKKHSKRSSTDRLIARDDHLYERYLNLLAERSELHVRSPKHHKSKLQKEIDSSKNLLNKDLKSEQKDQNKATQKALGGVNKAENHANKAVQEEISRAKKYQGEDEQRIAKAQAQLAKVAGYEGKSGKDGKKYQQALANEQKAEQDLVKLKQKGAASMARINAQEESDFAKTQAKLDKAMGKAHSSQFDASGQAKVHLSKWQKFKGVMKKIGTGLEWAATGLSMLIPGAEEFGAARMAVQAGKMIAEKVGKKVATKESEKAMKKGAKDGAEQMVNGKMVNVVNAAKTESQAQIAAAQANAMAGKNQVKQAIQTAPMPAANAALNRQLYGRYVSERYMDPAAL